jgi:hypothetical protein
MNDQQTQNPETPVVIPQQTKKSHGAAIGVVAGLVIAALAAAGVYYWQYQKVDDLDKKNASLTTQLDSVQKASKSAQSSGKATSGTISYKAGVGKFTLTLPDKYAFIQRSDGPGEGGSSTMLLVGDSTSTPGTVESSIATSITLSAYGLHGMKFRNLVDGDLESRSPYEKDVTVKIGGVDAESYKVGGLAAPKNIYFTKGDLFYKIEMSDTDAASNQKLAAIIAGFKFN